MSSFDSYIETIEMQGVCPTWLKSTQDQQALDGAVSKTPPPCSCARTPASERPTYQIRPNPRRGIQPEGDGGENGNFTLSMAYDVCSKG